MKDSTFSSKDLLLSISSMRKQAMSLINKGKGYDALIKEIIEWDYYDDDNDEPLPTSKDLQSKLNLSSSKIKSQLEKIYKDIFDDSLTTSDLFSFNKVEYYFYIDGWYNSIVFRGFVPVLPRVGDYMTFPFLKAFNRGGTRFHVKSISHEFTDVKQIISLNLEKGFYNSYSKFKNDKDKFEEDEIRERRIRNEMSLSVGNTSFNKKKW